MDTDQSQNTSIMGSFVNLLTNNHIFDMVKIGLLIYFVLLLFLTVCSKKITQRDTTPTRERLYKRFLYANYDLLKDIDEDEKKLMTITFENTVKNAQSINIKENTQKEQKKVNKKVLFNLENNEMFTYSIANSPQQE